MAVKTGSGGKRIPAGSTPYMEAGAALRRSAERAAKKKNPRLNGSDHRVLLVVHSQTASYSKLSDFTSVAQIAKLADLDHRDPQFKETKKSLKKLHEAGAIVWQPARKHGQRSLVSLPSADDVSPEGLA